MEFSNREIARRRKSFKSERAIDRQFLFAVFHFIVNMSFIFLIFWLHFTRGFTLKLNFSGFEFCGVNLFHADVYQNAANPLDPHLDFVESILIYNQNYLPWRLNTVAPFLTARMRVEYLYREACSVNIAVQMETCEDQMHKMRSIYSPRDQSNSQTFINIVMMQSKIHGCSTDWREMKFPPLFSAQYYSWMVGGSYGQYTI